MGFIFLKYEGAVSERVFFCFCFFVFLTNDKIKSSRAMRQTYFLSIKIYTFKLHVHAMYSERQTWNNKNIKHLSFRVYSSQRWCRTTNSVIIRREWHLSKAVLPRICWLEKKQLARYVQLRNNDWTNKKKWKKRWLDMYGWNKSWNKNQITLSNFVLLYHTTALVWDVCNQWTCLFWKAIPC